MAIQEGNIKLLKSQVMDDVPEGGGRATGTAIIDGASNSIFTDISELDRAYGRVNLRKTFVGVSTPDTEGYFGANIIVANPPLDPRVSCTIFSTKDGFDRRVDAQSRIESYLVSGSEWQGYLLENHVSGQRAIQLFQRPSTDLPPVGRTLLLAGPLGSQYVRITKVSSALRTFTYSVSQSYIDYSAQVVTCEISDALRYDMAGSAPSRDFLKQSGKTTVRDTLVADAAQYFGTTPLAVATTTGALQVTGESIFTQLVPSAQTEIPVVDANAAGEYDTLVNASNGNVTFTTTATMGPLAAVYVGNPIYPGSLTINYPGGVLTDSAGTLVAGTTVVGSVDYIRGLLTFSSSSPAYAGTKTISFAAAGAPLQLADSAGLYVSVEGRSYNYVQTIEPPPAPGSMRVSYRANGNWYDLRDNGGGVLLGGDTAFGTGTISYATGTLAITLGALPDVGSQILLSWGARVNYFNRAADAVLPLEISMQLGHTGVAPDSVSVSWDDGTARVATDNTAGVLSGDAAGTVNYQTGEIRLRPNVLPAGGQSYTVEYGYGTPDAESFPAPLRGGDGKITLSLAKTNIKPGSLEMIWNVVIEDYSVISQVPAEMQFHEQVDPFKTVRDDGAGALKDATGVSYGTVDYTLGTITFNPDTTVYVPFPRYTVTQIGYTEEAIPGSLVKARTPVYRNVFSNFEYVPAAATMPIDTSALVSIKYRAASSDTTGNEVITPGGLTFDLTNQYTENIVPGSVNFTLGGKSYYDTQGKLFADLDLATGSGILSGDINYQTGVVQINSWVPGAAPTRVIRSLLTTMDGHPVDEVTFRVPVAPIRPGLLQILATRLQGGLVNVNAATDGTITGTNVEGTVDYDTGVVRVRFGAWVVASGHESEIWYDVDAVRDDGKIFKPVPVFANTIRFNAVGFTYLPLDADLIGLDPVRLPSDGRVPIFRKGGMAVVHHTAITSPQTVANSTVVDVGRTRLSRLRVVGSDNVTIASGYVNDLDAGTVTFTDVTGYAQPVRVEHRIEDMALVSDAQINGTLSLVSQLTHSFPIGAYVSSALIIGDMKSRVPVLFDQATWNNIWSDVLQGSTSLATYDDVSSPIAVTNAGAITERWLIRFTNTTSFDVIGEHVGQIASGNTATDCVPMNAAGGAPYFSLKALGWGSGWSTGNVLRFNTIGALFPLWIARTIAQGPATAQDDSFTVLVRGDIDRP